MSNATTYLIFPNQLFHPLHIPSSAMEVVIIEDPLFFYSAARPFHIHKLKLAFHRASMRYYYDQTVKPVYPKAKYIDYMVAKTFKPTYPVVMHDPYDHKVIAKYSPVVLLPSPSFILTADDYKALPPNARNATIYKATRAKVKKFQNLENMDHLNREKLPKGTPIPPVWEASSSTKTAPYTREAQAYISKHFSKHIGDASKLESLALTRSDALHSLGHFLKNQFKLYGVYQDAVVDTETYMFHSNISYMLNAGLLIPGDVIKAVAATRGIPDNSLEGFIRQLLGWREYMGYIYQTNSSDLTRIFRPTSKSLSNKWYNATTGISPLDNEIKKALQHAYAHHIIRLMYFLNVFKLTSTHPYLIYKWFMEVVALDAYEWVMWGNIGAMGYYTKKHYMQKPYLSSSNYIRKLSNYKPGDWCQKWDTLFHSYLRKRKADGLLKDGESIYLRNIR
jgi:deoxyribodipyrimidine photolyase-related protein